MIMQGRADDDFLSGVDSRGATGPVRTGYSPAREVTERVHGRETRAGLCRTCPATHSAPSSVLQPSPMAWINASPRPCNTLGGATPPHMPGTRLWRVPSRPLTPPVRVGAGPGRPRQDAPRRHSDFVISKSLTSPWGSSRRQSRWSALGDGHGTGETLQWIKVRVSCRCDEGEC